MKLPRLRISKRGRGRSESSSDKRPSFPGDIPIVANTPLDDSKSKSKKTLFRARQSFDNDSQQVTEHSQQADDVYQQTSLAFQKTNLTNPSIGSHSNTTATSFTANTAHSNFTDLTQSTATTTGAITYEVPPSHLRLPSVLPPSTNYDDEIDENEGDHKIPNMTLPLPKQSHAFGLEFDKTIRTDREAEQLAQQHHIKEPVDKLKLPSSSPPPPLPPSNLIIPQSLSPGINNSSTQSPKNDIGFKANSITKSQTSSVRSNFSRRTIQDGATRLRRLLREKVSLYTRTSRGTSSTTLDDIPEPVDEDNLPFLDRELSSEQADAIIAQFAASRNNNNKNKSEQKQKASKEKRRKKQSIDSDVEDEDEIPRMPAEIPQLQPCSDRFVYFLVPEGWIGSRSKDIFFLSNGHSLGYVRSVDRDYAVDALMETDRLQVMSEIHALSSPVFGEDGVVEVNYFSHLGAGKGVAIFSNDVNHGACVFALCGLINDQDVIQKGIEDLKKTVRVLKVPRDDKRTKSTLGTVEHHNSVSKDVIKDVDVGSYDKLKQGKADSGQSKDSSPATNPEGTGCVVQ